MKKKEKIIIICILAAAVTAWLLIPLLRRDSETIRITVNGEEYGVYSLSEEQTILIGDTNVCQIRDGKARMIEASCPDHLCMQQGAIDAHGGTIVCLPNKVVIEGGKAEESGDSLPEPDATT